MNEWLSGLSAEVIWTAAVLAGMLLIFIFVRIMRKPNTEKDTAAPGAIREELPGQMIPAEESAVPDGSLIAVISAAIAACLEAETGNSGFIVRRVRRVSGSPAWQRAGRDEQMYSGM